MNEDVPTIERPVPPSDRASLVESMLGGQLRPELVIGPDTSGTRS